MGNSMKKSKGKSKKLKKTTTEMKNAFGGFLNRFGYAAYRIRKFYQKINRKFQNRLQSSKTRWKMQLGGNSKRCNIHIIGIPERT